jgi:hypothetical protein
VVPRLCAFAAAVTETLGGAEWAVLMRRAEGEAASAIARGGSPAELGRATRTTVVEHGTWVVEIGAAEAASTDAPVRTALDALVAVAVVGAT